jgi:hypothetical protein
MPKEEYLPNPNIINDIPPVPGTDRPALSGEFQPTLTLGPSIPMTEYQFAPYKTELPTPELRYLVRPWPEYVGPLAGTAKLQILQQRWLITSDVAGITTQTYEWRDVPTVEES